MLSTLVVASIADAEVLGRRQIGISVGATRVGEEYVDGTSLDFGARLRLPIGRNFDVVAFHGQSMLEGYDHQTGEAPYVKQKGTEYGVDLVCHFLPGRPADPFVSAGVSNVTANTTVDGVPTFADEDVKFKVGAGAEISLRRNVSLSLGLTYQDSFHDFYDSDVSAGIALDAWLTDVLLIGIGADGSFDSKDISASVRAGYGF